LAVAISRPMVLFCYRWREHAEARPLRLDSPLVFHSVSATNCLQNYNKIRNAAINLKNNSRIGERLFGETLFSL
jgi:hypothetical protein